MFLNKWSREFSGITISAPCMVPTLEVYVIVSARGGLFFKLILPIEKYGLKQSPHAVVRIVDQSTGTNESSVLIVILFVLNALVR